MQGIEKEENRLVIKFYYIRMQLGMKLKKTLTSQ